MVGGNAVQKQKVITRRKFLLYQKKVQWRKWVKGILPGKMCRKKRAGNIGEIMTSCFCILAMTVVVLSYFDHMQLIQMKTDVNQIARKYILRMETVGHLTSQDRTELISELQELGVTDVSLEGTTISEVTYGMPITLQIQGKLRGEYDFSEHRMSTSKN